MSKIPGLKKPTAVGTITTPAKEEVTESPKEGDPIGDSLEARDKKLGGLANQVTDVEAKKKSIPIYRAAKHPTMKGGVEVELEAIAAVAAAIGITIALMLAIVVIIVAISA